MTRAATTFVWLTIAVLASASLVAWWNSHQSGHVVRFKGESSLSMEEVKRCFEAHHHLFAEYELLYVRFEDRTTQSAYVARDGSKIVFSSKPTEVMVQSRLPLRKEQRDLLTRCLN